MAVISSVTVEDNVRLDGRWRVTENHTDQLGAVHSVQYIAEPGADTAATMVARVAGINAQLVEAEEEYYISAALNDGDLISIVPNHSTKEQTWKRLILAYRTRDKDYAIKILPLLQHINATFTDNQIKNFLEITQVQLGAIRSRAISLASLKIAIEADDALIEAE